MPNHLENRSRVILALREEIVGPSPQGQERDCSKEIVFDGMTEFYGPWRQQGSGEEILQRDRPVKRYGVGVLYPAGTHSRYGEEVDAPQQPEDPLVVRSEAAGQEDIAGTEDPLTDEFVKNLKKIEETSGSDSALDSSDDFDLSTANTYRPGSMGVSFLVRLSRDDALSIKVTGGRYRQKKVFVKAQEEREADSREEKTERQGDDADAAGDAEDKAEDQLSGRQQRLWWLRSPIRLTARFDAHSILEKGRGKILPNALEGEGLDGLDLQVELYSRPYGGEDQRLITVCLINRTQAGDTVDIYCLFQSFFGVSLVSPDGKGRVLPYPASSKKDPDAEEQSLALLYRNAETYAVGHGCAADWETSGADHSVSLITAECLPSFETPSTTPDITREDGTPIEVPMDCLAGLVPGDDGLGALTEVVELYAAWINKQEQRIVGLSLEHRDAAVRHLKECRNTADRMREGLAYLTGQGAENTLALQAFQLANHAILLQQIQTGRARREADYDPKQKRIVFSADYSVPDPLDPPPGRGKWRAFQIAFLLAALRSTADSGAQDRRTVELIWFPTGGGKTEAYLGLAAFGMFLRRLRDPSDAGTQVLMRYTLRLLTAQQFQRASSLLCAMDYLRRRTPGLEDAEFSIGIWVGGSTTPNTRKQAIEVNTKLQRGDRGTENLFLLNRCPWCGVHMGPLPYKRKAGRNAPRVIGYERRENSVALSCPDIQCEFAAGLPVYVIDEDIYEYRPSLIIGTIDKFAMLTWRPVARSLFGIGPSGERETSPPGLIIQDELHLISGPLGSITGLYETIIEELCTDRRTQNPVPPKMVCSTATIRRYERQVRDLYARDSVALFPPPGIDIEDSFFARYARHADGSLQPGRIYIGVHGPGLGSLQTAQVRTFTALLQAPVPFTPEERDPWWTLLLFFNSLRELGTTLSLLQSDIPDYLRVLKHRLGLDFADVRRLRDVLELTGRLRGDEVPQKIAALEVSHMASRGHPVDVCLASNIIEVGIDIDRLSLMAVVGQPRTTSQYIQVTGRVGRKWLSRPGLVVTIYGASKPRDRSHFEKFRSYHERLYAQVEPTSVTPFSPPVLDRALHAVIAAYARLTGDGKTAESPYPFPDVLLERLRDILLPRVQAVDPEEAVNFDLVFEKRLSEWRSWQRTRWSGNWQSADAPLLREAGAYVPPEKAKISWATPMSMRNVDAECQVEITTQYLNDAGKE